MEGGLERGFGQQVRFTVLQGQPETLTLVQSMRPTGATHHMAWETLTHAGTGAVGLR